MIKQEEWTPKQDPDAAQMKEKKRSARQKRREMIRMKKLQSGKDESPVTEVKN